VTDGTTGRHRYRDGKQNIKHPPNQWIIRVNIHVSLLEKSNQVLAGDVLSGLWAGDV